MIDYTTEFVRLGRFATDLQGDRGRVNDRYVRGLGSEFLPLLIGTNMEFARLVDSARRMENSMVQFGTISDPFQNQKGKSDLPKGGQQAPAQPGSENYYSGSSQANRGSLRTHNKGRHSPRSAPYSSGSSGSNRGSGRGYSGGSNILFYQNCRCRHYGQCQLAPGGCFSCGQPGHFSRECPTSGQQMSNSSAAQSSYQQ